MENSCATLTDVLIDLLEPEQVPDGIEAIGNIVPLCTNLTKLALRLTHPIEASDHTTESSMLLRRNLAELCLSRKVLFRVTMESGKFDSISACLPLLESVTQEQYLDRLALSFAIGAHGYVASDQHQLGSPLKTAYKSLPFLHLTYLSLSLSFWSAEATSEASIELHSHVLEYFQHQHLPMVSRLVLRVTSDDLTYISQIVRLLSMRALPRLEVLKGHFTLASNKLIWSRGIEGEHKSWLEKVCRQQNFSASLSWIPLGYTWSPDE